jgi:hypothetical protein
MLQHFFATLHSPIDLQYFATKFMALKFNSIEKFSVYSYIA